MYSSEESRAYSIVEDSVVGSPISCVSLPSNELLIYAQGSFLERAPLFENDPSKQERLLVFSSGGNIHGIRYATQFAVVFGGRQIAFVRNVLQKDSAMEILPTSTSSSSQAMLLMKDWIWDVRCFTVDVNHNNLVIGLAHNTVEIWRTVDLSSTIDCRCLHVVNGASRCISYCLDIGRQGEVAVGTVTNDILLWSVKDLLEKVGISKDTVPVLETRMEAHRLRGHEGVIHGLKFSQDGRLLASTSDDRSVRLWTRQSDEQHENWKLKWSGWGHTARGWSVAFSPHGLVSTGEDGTARLWDIETGSSLATLRGHACQCVWSVDTYQSLAVTGGDNGTVAVYNLLDRIVCERTDGSVGGPPSAPWTATFMVPNDCVLHKEEQGESLVGETEGETRTQKKKKKKVAKQIVVGMKVYRSHACSTLKVLVATRSGSLSSLDTDQGSWTEHEPWCDPTTQTADEIKASDGCSMCLHPSWSTLNPAWTNAVAIGTHRGDIVLVSNFDSGVHCRRVVLHAAEHKSVHKLEWVRHDAMLSFHVASLLWWKFPSLGHAVELTNGTFEDDSCIVLVPGTKGLAISHAYDDARNRLVVGDTRGHLALFELGLQCKTGGALTPISVLHKVHGREHVNDIKWTGANSILSAGNDGCIHECGVSEDGCLVSLLSVPTVPFTGITSILDATRLGSPLSLILSGYQGNVFSVVDVCKGYELFAVNTGGRQRAHDLYIDAVHGYEGVDRSVLAVCVNRKDGYNDVLVRCQLSDSHAFCTPYAFGVGLHHESIFDACLFSLDPSHKSLALLTGSEDCSSRISVWRDGSLVMSKQLPSQESGVRAVCSSRHSPESPKTLLVVGGAKLEMQFFLTDVSPASLESQDIEVRVELLGHGSPAEKATIDHRINAVKAAPLGSKEGGLLHLVAAGDSNGTCYLYRVDESKRGSYTGFLMFKAQRPILSLEVVTSHSSILLLAGTTAGDVMVFSLPSSCDSSNPWRGFSASVLASFSVHSIGTNAISAHKILGPDDGSSRIRVCTGGDDQAICCFEIEPILDESGMIVGVSVARFVESKEACFSAVKGVKWIDRRNLVATGYDRRLTLWRYEFPSVTELDVKSVGVGDVNCLAYSEQSRRRAGVVAVCGAGVELFSIVQIANNQIC